VRRRAARKPTTTTMAAAIPTSAGQAVTFACGDGADCPVRVLRCY
jgi:hypothetical protein